MSTLRGRSTGNRGRDPRWRRGRSTEADLKVGVADPDADRRVLLTKALSSAGLNVALDGSKPADWPDSDREEVAIVVLGADVLGPEVFQRIGRLRERWPETRIVVVAEVLGHGPTRGAFDAGVDGVVWANDVFECLALTVRSAHAGQLSAPRDWRDRFETPVLSPRQKQVLGMVVMGFTNGRIAGTLGVAESTVKSHLTSAFRKLGVHSRTEATALILDPDNGLGPGILGIPKGRGAVDRTGLGVRKSQRAGSD